MAVVKCDGYGEKNVKHAVEKGIHLLGGLSCFAAAGEQILLKPNLLVADKPERAVTTHPEVFRAVAEMFKQGGARLSYGDSPAIGSPDRVFRKTGMHEIADALGIETADFKNADTVSFPGALLARRLFLARGVLAADGIVSIAKMKTHGFTRITGAVKNQFGCVPGLRKGDFHFKMPDIYDFSKVMVDINRYLRPRLYIMDGITAMEGNGPRGGEPVDMKVLLFSADPVALDAVCCRLIDLDPQFVPTCTLGQDSGLGTCNPDEIELVGDPVDGLINKQFKAVRRPPERLASVRHFPTFFKRLVSPRPVIGAQRCSSCGQCVRMCPARPSALEMPENEKKGTGEGQHPVFNYNHCIRCYCCQEICPEKAIHVRVPLLGRLIYR